MKIVLGNFKLWRMKKFLIFTICIWSSILILLSGANPGSTREAWKSSNNFPPNSR